MLIKVHGAGAKLKLAMVGQQLSTTWGMLIILLRLVVNTRNKTPRREYIAIGPFGAATFMRTAFLLLCRATNH
jgi:hypothetical protein